MPTKTQNASTTAADLIGRKVGAPRGRDLPYREIPDKLSAREPFTGRSMSAHLDTEGRYVVLSYATVIAVWAPGEGATIIDRNRWGNVTGRHINLCRAHLA